MDSLIQVANLFEIRGKQMIEFKEISRNHPSIQPQKRAHSKIFWGKATPKGHKSYRECVTKAKPHTKWHMSQTHIQNIKKKYKQIRHYTNIAAKILDMKVLHF